MSSSDFPEDEGLSETKQSVIIRLAVSTIGLERIADNFGNYRIDCDIVCIEQLHTKVIQFVRNNLETMFRLKSKVKISAFNYDITMHFIQSLK